MSNHYKIFDVSDLSPEIIAKLLYQRYLISHQPNETPADYYCGIATDPDDRFSDHEANDWAIDEIIALYDCGDPNGQKPTKAGEVETIMAPKNKGGEYGFDVGEDPKRGEGDHTRYVYLVRKGRAVSSSGSLKEGQNKPKPLIDFLKDTLTPLPNFIKKSKKIQIYKYLY